MVSDFKEDEFFFWLGCLEEQPQAEPGSALKNIRAQLSDAGPQMGVGKSPSWQHIQQGLIDRRSFFRGQLADLAKTTFRQLNPPRGLRCFR